MAVAEVRGRPGPQARQCAVIVLGAGRSGTSAITRGLQALGVELGDRLRRGAGKNPTGFFEDKVMLKVNRRLKRALGIRAESVALIEPAQWQTPEVQALRGPAAEAIVRRFGRYPLWGYKYARTLRMLPFWEEVFRSLDLDVRYVVAIRNPLSVARSRSKLDRRRGTQEKSDLEWLVSIVPYFRQVRERPFVVVDYDLLMAGAAAQLERIGAALGLPIDSGTRQAIRAYADGFLRSDMRHTVFTDADLERDGSINEVVRDAYRWLRRLATDEVGPRDPVFWQGWEAVEDRIEAMAPLLRHIDRVQADLRRAQLNPLGPLQFTPHIWRKLRNR